MNPVCPHQAPLSFGSQNKISEATPEKVVISASRRTDLVSCYPQQLIERLVQYPPQKVHTVVIWTKNPENALKQGKLREILERYDQLYIHLTITGLGGTVLEPGIPPWQKVVAMLPDLIGLVKDPRRITWRFDPLVRVKYADTLMTNSNMFHMLAEKIMRFGIDTCRISWVEPYRKVLCRLQKRGFLLLPWSDQEKKEQAAHLEWEAARLGIKILYCSVQGFPRSRCIDGGLLSILHPAGELCSQKKAKGQRPMCGCTESIDIGWYSMKCKSGCLYCYAEPMEVDTVTMGEKTG